MSIFRARLKGNAVSADDGEKLRGKDVVCINCGAKMHIHKFPGRDDYYFALNPGENHTSTVCETYAGAKNAPVLTNNSSPDELIELWSNVSKPGKSDGTGGSGGTTSGSGTNPTEDYKPKKITRLKQFIETGIYDENPFEKTYKDTDYRFIDYVIFDKWARYIWRDSKLINIGARIVDARWIGSFSFSEAEKKRIISITKATKEIWLTMFWKVDKAYVYVRFCLDCTSCFSAIKKKVFTSGIDENGAYFDFAPKKGDKVDLLVGARWAPMNNEQCKEKCPLNKKCANCLGAYWGKCHTPKQVEPFPPDEFTKNKEKKIDG